MRWKAKSIWVDNKDNTENRWVCFRKKFVYDGGNDEVILNIFADSRYTVYINGRRLGAGPVRCWPFEQMYDTYQVKSHLVKGHNAIAVLVNHYGASTSQYIHGCGGLIAQMDFYSGNGVVYSISTNSGWKCSDHSGYDEATLRINVAQPWMEIYDTRKFSNDWVLTEYDDLLWNNSEELGDNVIGPWTNLVRRDIPPLTWEEIYPKRVTEFNVVKTVGQHVCVDIRRSFFPEVYDSIDKKLLGYLTTILVAGKTMTGKVRLLSRQWPEKNERMKINGVEYVFGPFEDEKEVLLQSGRNLCIIDISGYHQRFTMSYYFDFDGEISYEAPLYGESYGFATIGPFESGNIINIAAVDNELNFDNRDYLRIWDISDIKELICVSDWIKPVQEKYIVTDNPHIKSMIRSIVQKKPVDKALADFVIPNEACFTLNTSGVGDSEIIVDFGKEQSAFVSIDIECDEGTIIDMEFVESIHDGIIEYPTDMNSAMRYIACEGRQNYLSHLRRGFRYIVVTIRNFSKPVSLYNIKAYGSNFPVTASGSFMCSDWQLNEIWNISSRSVLLCMEDTFVDCPAYEQAYWIGDARNEALICYYTFGAYDLMKRCIRLVAGSLRHSRLPEAQVPTGCNTVLTAWVMLWIISCKEYYEFSGDIEGIASIYPDILKCMYSLLEYVNKEDLLEIQGWNLLDWAGMDTPASGIVTHQNAFLVKALNDTAFLASKMNDVTNEDLLTRKAELIKASINKYLWNDAREAYIDSIHSDGERSSVISMQTNIVVYLCGCTDGERKSIVEGYFLNAPKDFVQIGSPFMSFFYFEALLKIGKSDLVLQHIKRDWGGMLKYGATTCWETFPGFEKKRLTRSHCHGWSAAPGYFLGAYILGVKPTKPGFEEIIIEPFPCGLEWAKGVVPTPIGPVHVEWEIENGKFHIDVDVPEGCSYVVKLPNI